MTFNPVSIRIQGNDPRWVAMGDGYFMYVVVAGVSTNAVERNVRWRLVDLYFSNGGGATMAVQFHDVEILNLEPNYRLYEVAAGQTLRVMPHEELWFNRGICLRTNNMIAANQGLILTYQKGHQKTPLRAG